MLPCPRGRQSCGWKQQWASAALHEEETSRKDARRGGWQRGKLLHGFADFGLQVCGCGRSRGREGAGFQAVRLLEQTVRQGASEGVQAEVVRVWSEEMLLVLLQDSPRCLAARSHRDRRRVLLLRCGGGRGSVRDSHRREGVSRQGRNFSGMCLTIWQALNLFCCHLSLPFLIVDRQTHPFKLDIFVSELYFDSCMQIFLLTGMWFDGVQSPLREEQLVKGKLTYSCGSCFPGKSLISTLLSRIDFSAHCLHSGIFLDSDLNAHELIRPHDISVLCKGSQHLMWWPSVAVIWLWRVRCQKNRCLWFRSAWLSLPEVGTDFFTADGVNG